MAQAGGAAAGAGGGGGGDEIPDVRFLLEPREQELYSIITREQKEQLLVKLLRLENVDQKELNMSYRMSDAMLRQPPPVAELYRRGCELVISVYRKRRHAIFLMIMLRTFGGRKNLKIEVPNKYRERAQLLGDIAALENQISIRYEEALEICEQVKNVSHIPLSIPDIFKDPVRLPQ